MRAECGEHGTEVVLCGCGYRREGITPPKLPAAHLFESDLLELWEGWSEEERAAYKYWLELAKPFERGVKEAACWAVGRCVARPPSPRVGVAQV